MDDEKVEPYLTHSQRLTDYYPRCNLKQLRGEKLRSKVKPATFFETRDF